MIETTWEHTNIKKTEITYKNNKLSSVKFSTLLKDNPENQFLSPKKNNLGPQFTNKFINDNTIDNILNFYNKNQHKALFLSKNNLTDIGFNKLSTQLKNQPIEHYILSHNKIQFNEFAKAGLIDLLKKNRHIGWLVLNNNEIENKGAINLAIALKENVSIKHIVLSNNKIGDLGLKHILENIETHPNIESLFIESNKLTSLSIHNIINFILKNESIKRIDISKNFETSENCISQLRKICDKKKIKLLV